MGLCWYTNRLKGELEVGTENHPWQIAKSVFQYITNCVYKHFNQSGKKNLNVKY